MAKADQPAPSAGHETARVVFTPSGKRGDFPHGMAILDAARALGVDIDSVCGGRGICGRCQIAPAFGDFSKFRIKSRSDHLTPFSAVEERYHGKRGLAEGRRLGCSSRICGDLVIDVPAESQVHKQVVRKRAEVRDIKIDPLITLHYIEVDAPDTHHPSGDLERVLRALHEQWQLDIGHTDLPVLRRLQKTLRAGDWKITAAVRDACQLIHVWPGFHDRAFGCAADVGSTTMSAHLCDLKTGEVVASVGAMNPQIRFGEDLMSRVSYVMMNPGGDTDMTDAVRATLGDLIVQACREGEVETDDLLDLTLVGNPIMHHLMLGIDPTELGWAPFALASNEAMIVRADELGLAGRVNDGARVYFLPCVAGHVGADAAAVALSEAPHTRDEVSLIIDVGTNAEIILGNRQRLLACSSPTGPALEGAQISSGQRAAAGAIERVRIDPATLEPKMRVIGTDAWISDVPDANSENESPKESGKAGSARKSGRSGKPARSAKPVAVTGICGSGIIEVLAEMFLAGLITPDGVIDGNMAARTTRIVAHGRTFSYILHRGEGDGAIMVTQADVRAIQLAKAALYAGAQLLIDKFGRTPDRVVLAGAFGSHIDPKYAMVLGLAPDCPLDRVHAAGNAAGTGARIALLNKGARAEIGTVVRDIEKIETAVEPDFQTHFVNAMAFPHKTAPFHALRQVVDLPVASTPATGTTTESARRGRRRRGGAPVLAQPANTPPPATDQAKTRDE